MPHTMNTWWWTAGAAVSGIALGAAASTLTRRGLHQPDRVAGSWWLGGALTAVALGVLGWRFAGHTELLVYTWVAVLGVPLAVIDVREHRLPRALTWPQLAGTVAGIVTVSLARHDLTSGGRALLAGLATALVFAALAAGTRGGVGGGDLPVAATAGAVTGWTGWPQSAAALLTATLLALPLLAVPALRRRHGEQGAAVPFGPCLLAGALIVLLSSG